ncbi:MAG TPA: type II secretion system protein [Candidatus Aenigmarchaeota archaeon]|nr:type II secretion system protein [Candidatus Aenigmarchaeota archaeon]
MKRLKAFTMIELLVVIAVIGILSVALLATLNPLEQIRKGRDTRTRADASQLVSAIERYNASLGYFPWQSSEGENLSTGAPDINFIQINGGGSVPNCSLISCAVADVLNELANTNEVKAGFIDRITSSSYNDVYLFYNDENTGASVTACFRPESNTFSREAFDRCKSGSWGNDFVNRVYCTTGTCPCPDAADQNGYSTLSFDPGDADEMICIP